MRCPNCSCHYYVELIEPYQIETCHICGYQADFNDFVEHEVIPDGV